MTNTDGTTNAKEVQGKKHLRYYFEISAVLQMQRSTQTMEETRRHVYGISTPQVSQKGQW